MKLPPELERLSIQFDNHISFLSTQMLDKQNAWGNLEALKEAHWLKQVFYSLIRETDDKAYIKELAKDIQEVEFELQRLWGFKLDANFHRFWEYPKCKCPQMDNVDSYPFRQYINAECPLHGQ